MSSEETRWSASLSPELCVSFIEDAPVGIFVAQDSHIVYGNSWLRTFSGHGASADLPLDVFALIHPDDRELVREQMRLRLAGQDARASCPVRLVGSGGDVREVELYAKSVLYLGRPAIQGTLVDITARIDAERNLQEYASRLEDSNRFRLLFGDILSHDLMNPVWIAENYLRLVMDGGIPEDKRTFYEGMRGSLVRARVILTDARTFLRIQDRVAFAGESIAVVPLVEGVAQSLRPLWEEKRQTVTFTIAPDAVISGSPLLKEVVWHLLSNAIKFGPPDTPIDVVVSVGPRVRLEVRDRGPGVPQEDRERIFQRFQRMEKGPINGVGLGLAITRRVAALHNGRVWVEENPGGGSVFVAEFPATESAQTT